MSKIVIGTEPSGKQLRLDVDLLIPSRLLIQANSGGGKSWLLRRLAEQFYGRVQTIIIDPEGEFFTLREKYGYVLVGEGGETPCDVRSAAMLAERFLELKASAVCDLYEAFRSRPMERRQWVRYFLNALIDAPRKLWHPLIVIVDEAHKFCPQETPKSGNQLDREIIGGCKDAMISLSTTGRKRGFCSIWATQRLAKLDKDASAELFNRLVGMTIEDVDVDRAADLMSVSKNEKQEFRHSLRTLNPGEFYAFGRAITTERTLVKVGEVETRHPESGKQAAGSTAPPMPAQVKKFLPQLSDLPKEAEEKARTEAELKREIRELKTKLTAAERATKQVAPSKLADKRAIDLAVKVSTLPLLRQLETIRKQAKQAVDNFAKALAPVNAIANLPAQEIPKVSPSVASSLPSPLRAAAPSISIAPRRMPAPAARIEGKAPKLGAPGRKIAAILAAYYPESISIKLLASMIGTSSGGYLSGRLSEVRSNGLLADPSKGFVIATEQCAREFAGQWQRPTSIDEALAVWSHKIGQKHRMMIDRLVEAGGEPVAIGELGQIIGATSGGYLSGRISELRSTGLVLDAGKGFLKANPEALFMAS